LNELSKLVENIQKDMGSTKSAAGINTIEKISIGLTNLLEKSIAISSKKK
jgi:hypothetical protein